MGRCKIGLEDVSYLLALAGGLAAFFSPCVLPMMPIYLASLAGADVLDAQPNSITSFKALRHSIAFVAGFSLVFTSLGALSGLGGVIINPSDLWVRILSGGMLVIFGTYMLLSLRFPSLSFEKHLASQQNLRTGGYIRSFLSGAVFTLAWTPCISPMLGSILSITFGGESPLYGSALLAVFSLGMGIPFVLLGLLIQKTLPLVHKISRYSAAIYGASGVILIFIGILILGNRIGFFSTLQI
ncbi:cytochrome C biogenesis protein CcdA [Dehalococcoides mccartyi]|jgi:cytochrome c-type biogenesis protein|uniref:Cytochrome c-type biogenesis protein CcdA n=2 Tax=Dehalococcoides mccartyi TaxID=61435 RepID=A0A328EQB4_9CHLR|nr:cytochrome c biogenesis protein CcdA [Dehalococcoides mccartyi]AII60716.1 cytochrome C biogenesis protein CcsB [Dehalococcoides mccartyi CG5]CAI82780.1 cytochrome c-type biogenesis protein CcdA [Dehalococcoides mccartyi CBDB1]AOV99214.1 cytochrome c-type biogenesis protein CcdA [Dehalococcoides mccartyi]AQU05699.1 cytochrome C biogenesis protein CcdA [Dehalococcoides mccartyi]AQU07145.1 cytochrome C biogenesis protein CcdA [Dehalococcoides mccartyi]